MSETGLMAPEQFADFEVEESEPEVSGECAVVGPDGIVFDLETACQEALGKIDESVARARIEMQEQTDRTLVDIIVSGKVDVVGQSVPLVNRMAWMANTVPFALIGDVMPGRRVLAEDLAA